ncbi:MAG: T9SS type A sorting domain-containing protein, partial [Saprospiraceae bacterium]|nr:T9SS type A sorting domain-containing protein [Saprospiraceae bacterium]
IRLVFGENPDLNGEIQIVDALGHQYLTKFLNRDNEGDWVNIYDLESGFYWITFRNNRHIGISKFLKM